MRLVTWNCRVGGFRNKTAKISLLRPDILVAQEVELLDGVLLFAGQEQPTYHHRISDSVARGSRGVGVFSYTGAELRPVDVGESMSFRRYEVKLGVLEFQVVGAWTWKTNSSVTSYRQLHDGLLRHAEWIAQRPTVVLGDFNGNASFQGSNWKELLELMQQLGLVSAYHHHYSERFGEETRPTHYHLAKEAAPFHLDYCFVPEEWARRIKKVEVGSYADWCDLSDHVPLVVDLDLGESQ